MNISKITVKRLKGDLRLLKKQPLPNIKALPSEESMLEWYFIIKGPDDSHYSGGIYLGKILHNPEYPLKAPDFIMLTPNGRFDINKKICLTNSGYHSESWTPMWNIRAILLGFLSIMLSDDDKGISHIKQSESIRKQYAKDSDSYNKKNYGDIYKKLVS